jgi:hypothetical protein
MSLHLKTVSEIDASPEEVWAVLSDLDAYEAWNPFMLSATGTLAEGERLDIRMRPPGGKARRFRPTVRAAVPGRELRWLGSVGVPGVFDGEHAFTIEATDGGSRLTHEERFTGVLVPLMARSLRRQILPAFEAMNAALKARAEAAVAC